MSTRKVARSSISGRFVTQEYARRYRGTTQVETVNVSSTGVRRIKRRCDAGNLTEENQNRSRFRAGKDLFKAGRDVRSAKEKKTGSNFKAGRDL
jgi:hypothetical protein